jgi:NADH dehydrogenase (ubiquinone) 1 alpha subcomplex subunit 9
MTPIAQLMNKLVWYSVMSKDSVAREFIDQTIDPSAKTFKDLGIESTDLANFTYHYLVSYRSVVCLDSIANNLYSKHTVVHPTTTCPP